MPADGDKLINVRGVQQFIAVGHDEITAPREKDGAGAHDAIALHHHDGAIAKTLVLPQCGRISRAIIDEQGMSFADQPCFNLGAFFDGFGGIQQGSFERFSGNTGHSVREIQTAEPFQPGHFFMVGIGLLAFARDALDGLAPLVQRVGELAIVLQERSHPGQMVFRYLFHDAPLYRKYQKGEGQRAARDCVTPEAPQGR
jgi:hypothetical protein